MSHIDLEDRLAALETAIEARVDLQALRVSLATLEKEPVIKTLFKAVERHPAAFEAPSVDATLTLKQKADLVLGHASTISDVAADLQLLSRLDIPPVASTRQLVDLLPDIDTLWDTVEAQDAEIEALSRRTLTVLDDWYCLHVRLANEAMVEVERDVSEVARRVRALEVERNG